MADAQTFHRGIRVRMCDVSKHETKHHEAYASPHAHCHHRGPIPFRNHFIRPYHRSSSFSRVQQYTHCCRSWLQQGSNLTLSQNYRRHRGCSAVLSANISFLWDPTTNHFGSGSVIHCSVHSTTLHHSRNQSKPQYSLSSTNGWSVRMGKSMSRTLSTDLWE